MNKVTVSAEEVPAPLLSGAVESFALKVLEEIKRENWELSILFCGDKTIADLNRKYRNKNEPTDVLSFNLGETIKNGDETIYLPGDNVRNNEVLEAIDTLSENAKYFQISEDEELRRLLIHGILHLDDMDHETNEKDEPMLVLQENILNKLTGEKIIFTEERT